MSDWRIFYRTRRGKLLLACGLLMLVGGFWYRQPRPPFVAPAFEIGGTLNIVVVDEHDERVANATVITRGLRAAQEPGSFFSWMEEEHGPLEVVATDHDGVARIDYPKWVSRKSGLLTSGVVVDVEHPDFCLLKMVECEIPRTGIVTAIPRARLIQGGRLRIKAYHEGSTEPLADFYALVSGNPHGIGWKPDDDARLSPPFLPGPHVMRIVNHTDPMETQFSDAIFFDLVARQTDDLEIHLRRGMMVRGQLDAPKPVRNGFVVVEVVDLAAGGASTFDQYVVWKTWTKADENGEFEFASLPPAKSLRIVAWCDGYVSQPPAPTTIPPYLLSRKFDRMPQFFEIDPDQAQLRVAMEPCAKCEVALIDIDGQPTAGVRVEFFPNVISGVDEDALFGHATRLENDLPKRDLSDVDYVRSLEKSGRQAAPKSPNELRPEYGGLTDANGKILITNLPGHGKEPLWIEPDQPTGRDAAKPSYRANLDNPRVDLQPGKTSTVSMVVEPKPALTPSMLASPPTPKPSWTRQAIDYVKGFFAW